MNLDELQALCAKHKSEKFIDALASVAIWGMERVVEQYKHAVETNQP